MDRTPLDNPTWFALTGTQREFAEGEGLARRFLPDVSVFGAIAEDSEAAWADLAALVGPRGGTLVNRVGAIVPPTGWTTVFTAIGDQMVLDREPMADDAPGTRALGEDDVEEVLALVALTEPGPFRARTIDLGGYHGIVVDGRIVAMAGRRTATEDFVEISAVCTHPDGRRRGYAAAITSTVARSIIAEGRTPILDVADSNPTAKAVYDRLGFVTHQSLSFAALRAPD